MTFTSMIVEPSGIEETDLKCLEAARIADTDWDLAEGKGNLVLVVGAEPAFRDMARIALERCEYGVLTAAGESDALSEAMAHREDLRLVLCSLAQDGADLANVVREISAAGPAAIVLCGNPDGSGTLDTVIHSGNVRAVLPNVYTTEQLLRTVREAIRGNQSLN